MTKLASIALTATVLSLSVSACDNYESQALDEVCWAYNDLAIGYVETKGVASNLPEPGTEEFERVQSEIVEHVLASARERRTRILDTSRVGREYRWRDSLERIIDKHCSGHF